MELKFSLLPFLWENKQKKPVRRFLNYKEGVFMDCMRYDSKVFDCESFRICSIFLFTINRYLLTVLKKK